MVTVELKDKILSYALANYPRGLHVFDTDAFLKKFDLDYETFANAGECIARNGFFKMFVAGKMSSQISVNAGETVVFLQEGGFVEAQKQRLLNRELLRLQVEKLITEFNDLRRNNPELIPQMERMTNIISNIATAAGVAFAAFAQGR